MPSSKLRGLELVSKRYLVNAFSDLCRDDPLSTHCYVVYYALHEPERIELIVSFSRDSIESYALIKFAGEFAIEDLYEVYVWRPTKETLSQIDIPSDKRVDIQLYDYEPRELRIVLERFKELGFRHFHVGEFYDMVCTRESFTPSDLEVLATKLREEHATLYRDLELERDIEISLEEAKRILQRYTHYGVIVNGILASIAASYVTLPQLWVLGGVYTRKRFRGRGYAKAVVSALTRDIVSRGALAGLHVETSNEPALRVYKSLGYKILRIRTWIFAKP